MAFGKYQIRIRHVLGSWGPWIDVFDEDYQFTDLLPNTEYCVQTRAFCDTGSESDLSNEYCFITPNPEEPAEPAYRPFLAYWSGPTSDSPFTEEFGPLSQSGERFIWRGGDIKVTVVATTGATANVTSPSGYAHAPGSPFVNTDGDKKINVLWKRIAVEEPLSVLDIGDPDAWTLFYVFRGCAETGDPWVDFATLEGTGTSITFPSVLCEENSLVLFAVNADDPAGTDVPTTSSFAYNWVNSNLKYIANLDGSDLGTGSIGHIGALAVSTSAAESGTTTCDLVSNLEYAAWIGSLKPASIRKPLPVIINTTQSLNINGFGESFSAFAPVLPEESNYIFAFVESSDAVTQNSTWTEAPGSPVINSGGTNATRLAVFYKKITPTIDVDVAFNRMGSAYATGCCIIRGAILTGNPFESILTSTGSGTAITIPGNTSTLDNSLIIQAVGRDTSTNNTASHSAWANADLTSVTERVDRGTSTGAGAGIGVVTGVKATAGAFGATTATLVNNTAWATWQAVIKPEGLSAPTFINSNNLSGAGYPTSTLLNSTSAGIQENDLLITLCAADRGAPDKIVYGEDYGWTYIPTTVSTTGVGVAVAYKRASGVSHLLGFTSSNDHRTVSYMVVNGLDPDNPIVSVDSNTGVGTTATVDGDTTTEDNVCILHAVASGAPFTPLVFSSDWTNSDLSNLSRGIESRMSLGNGGFVDTAIGYKDVAGEFGSTTVTLNVSDAWAMWRAILKTKP